MKRVPEMRQRQQSENDAVPDVTEEMELEMLSSKIPKLLGILPDVLRDKPGGGVKSGAALSVMLTQLLTCMDPLRPVCGLLTFFSTQS